MTVAEKSDIFISLSSFSIQYANESDDTGSDVGKRDHQHAQCDNNSDNRITFVFLII